ncbi:hypothetical protein J6590_041401 [Homalodisca vitripennis]|nr:hypothetical protein J6590_041401 [Homalodisca vitripennis]
MGDFRLGSSSSTDFLGLEIDSNLPFHIHSHKVSKKLSGSLFVMRRLASFASREVLITAYYGCFYTGRPVNKQPGWERKGLVGSRWALTGLIFHRTIPPPIYYGLSCEQFTQQTDVKLSQPHDSSFANVQPININTVDKFVFNEDHIDTVVFSTSNTSGRVRSFQNLNIQPININTVDKFVFNDNHIDTVVFSTSNTSGRVRSFQNLNIQPININTVDKFVFNEDHIDTVVFSTSNRSGRVRSFQNLNIQPININTVDKFVFNDNHIDTVVFSTSNRSGRVRSFQNLNSQPMA